MKKTIINGFKNSVSTIFYIVKIILPVLFVVKVLEHSGLLVYIAEVFKPLMSIFGLPGEAALALLLGNFVNIYGALTVITTITLTSKQITIIALMVLFSHSNIVETTIVGNLGVKKRYVVIIRVVAMILTGIILNLVL